MSQEYPPNFMDLLNSSGSGSSPGASSSASAPQTSNPSPPGYSSHHSMGIPPFNQQYYPYTPQPQQYYPYPPPQFHQPQPQFHQHQPQPQPQPQPEPQPQPQPQQPPQVTHGGHDDEEVVVLKKGGVNWTEEDEVKLTQRWIDATENSIVGNSQTEDSFWGGIGRAFNPLVREKRNKNALTGKWAKIRAAVTKWNPIWIQVSEARRASGADDKAVYDAAQKLYKQQNGGKMFNHERCWRLLRDCPKFWGNYGVTGNKRILRDEPIIRLDEDMAEPVPDTAPLGNPNLENLLRDDTIRRPPGRDTARKSLRSASSSDATSSRQSTEEAVEKVG